MRRWLLVLMLLLLPVRGLVGEVMAGQMLQQQVAAAVQASHDGQAHDHEHGHEAHAGDHAGHAASDHDGDEHAAAQPTADCPTCATCQMCSSVALGTSPAAMAAEPAPQALPHTAQRAYPSAEPALAFKPPRG